MAILKKLHLRKLVVQMWQYVNKNPRGRAVGGRKAGKVWKLMDELVEAVKILHPRMYTTFIDKVQDL